MNKSIFFVKQKTAYEMRISDWSADVGAADLEPEPCRYGPAGGPTYAEATERELAGLRSLVGGTDPLYGVTVDDAGCFHLELRRSDRSEERRVGNECVSTCRSRGSP